MGLNFAFALVHSRIDSGEWSFAIGSAVGGALMFPVVFMLLLQIPRKFRNDRSRYITLLAVSSLMLFGSYPQIKRLVQTGSTAPIAATGESRSSKKIDPKTFADAGLVFASLPSPAWSSEPISNTKSNALITRRSKSSDGTRMVAIMLVQNLDPSESLADSARRFKSGLLKPGLDLKSETPVTMGDTQGTLIAAVATIPAGKMNVLTYYAINDQFVYAISLSRLNGEVTGDAELRAFASTIRIHRL